MEAEPEDNSPSIVSNRTMEMVVALLLLGGSAIVVKDSLRIGVGWAEGEGPAAGYFPFYVALVLGLSSLVNLARAAAGNPATRTGSFVSRSAFGRVCAVLLPAIVYVAAIEWIGLYVASGIFIALFMVMVGGEKIVRAILVGFAVPIFFFLMFERWFLVPLPKGPLEAMLGF
jgi:putative tricarboxylic transport membrane protein